MSPIALFETKIARKSNISNFYYGGVVEGGVLAAEEVAEGIADEAGVTDCQVGEMIGMTVDPCRDSTVGYVVAKFGSIGCVEHTAFMYLFDGCECGEMVSDHDYFLGVANIHRLFDEGEVPLEFIVNVLRNESTFVVENLDVVVHAALDSNLVSWR